MTWEATETALSAALYIALGQSISYDPTVGDEITIYSIVDDDTEFIGGEGQVGERITTARVKVADVAAPKRGDEITASGTDYLVDGVSRLNNAEWQLQITEVDR